MNNYGLILGSDTLADRLFGPGLEELDRVPARRVGPIVTPDRMSDIGLLATADALVTGWGAPRFDTELLRRFPNLRHIVHAGGLSPVAPGAELADVDIRLAADVNAIPVAEYTLAMILLARKSVFRSVQLYRERRGAVDREVEFPEAGNASGQVGIVGASRIGRMVIELLRPFDLGVVVHDPYLDQDDADALGVRTLELPDLLATSDVISLHAPLTDETSGMIGASELALIRDGATVINSARGALIEAGALERELRTGRISAVLDVTDPTEPLPATSALWDLPNVVLTPHMAGSVGNEIRRMGRYVGDVLVSLTRTPNDSSYE